MTQVAPHTHEVQTNLYYGPVDAGQSQSTDYDGMDFYHAVADLTINECDGYLEAPGVDIEGENCDLRLNYSGSGIAPRPADPIDAETLYEFDVHIDGEGERKANFNISPRFQQMHKPNGDPLTFPFDHTPADEGVTVAVNSSNIPLDDLPDLFARALFELADAADVGFYHGYLEGPFGGRINAVERYLRITRSMNEKLIGSGGLLDRMAMLLTDQEGTSGHYRFDNEEERGHHHAIRHNSEAARTLIKHHSLGGQIKTYLPKDPDEHDPGDPLHHPKVGTKLIKKRNAGGSVSWSDRHDVVRELDERLLSVLSWAGIPTEAGGTTYVSDWHFDADPTDDPVALHADPLPQLEERQEHVLMTCLREMTPAHADLTETLATDGGSVHARDLAEETDYSLSTVYRWLQRLDGVVESDNGHVQFVSQKLREEVRALVESAEHTIANTADRLGELVRMDLQQSASSAFDKWLAKYSADVDWPDQEGGEVRVRLDTLLSSMFSDSRPSPDAVIEEMYAAWRKDGRRESVLDGGILEAETRMNGSQTFRITPP